LAKDPARRGRLGRVLRQAAAAIRGVAVLVAPVMPGSAQKIWGMLGEEGSIHKTRFADFDFDGPAPGAAMKAPQPLFPRVDVKEFLAEEAAPQPNTMEGTMDYLSYEEFAKMDLRVAHVLKAERVEGAKKLIKLQIDVGTDKRQIVAGVAETYAPESLEGKKIIVIVNLKPAVIRGVESNGMLLAAVVADKAVIPFVEGDVPAGTKVK